MATLQHLFQGWELSLISQAQPGCIELAAELLLYLFDEIFVFCVIKPWRDLGRSINDLFVVIDCAPARIRLIVFFAFLYEVNAVIDIILVKFGLDYF